MLSREEIINMVHQSIDTFLYSLLELDPESKLVGALNFFIYDSIKIFLLLFVMISVIGFIRSFLPQSKIRAWLIKAKAGSNLAASSLGALTPFCSCSSIPFFFGFLKAGVPLGVTFSFLITSPLVNEYLVVLMLGFFGWKITVLYVISGILIGVISGLVLGKMRLERFIVSDMAPQENQEEDIRFENFRSRIRFGIKESIVVIKKIWHWILIGVGIGAIIHNYVPSETIQGIIAKAGIFSVPIAVVLGVPLYGSCAAIVPIAMVLFEKGIPLGTALAFMMAVAALSLPEAVMLRRAMKLQLIFIFFGITTLAIIFTGYLFNFLY